MEMAVPNDSNQLKVKLANAGATVVGAKKRLHQLHGYWFLYLLCIGFFMVTFAFFQVIELYRDLKLPEEIIYNAYFKNIVYQRAKYGSCEIIGILLCLSITWFLKGQRRKASKEEEEEVNNNSSGTGSSFNFLRENSYCFCCVVALLQLYLYISADGVELEREPNFPVGIVFFVVVSFALVLMNRGRNEINKTLDLVNQVKEEWEMKTVKTNTQKNKTNTPKIKTGTKQNKADTQRNKADTQKNK